MTTAPTNTMSDDFDVDRAIDNVRDTLKTMIGRDAEAADLETAAIGIVHEAFDGDDDEVLRAAGDAALRVLSDYVFALYEKTSKRAA